MRGMRGSNIIRLWHHRSRLVLEGVHFGILHLHFIAMLLRTLILLILPLAISAVDPVECAEACQTPMTYVQFTGSPTSADYYASSCTNLLLVQSTFLCMRYYCPEDGITAGLASLDKTCQTYGAVELLPWSIISNISTEQLLAWPHIEYADLGGVDAYDTPIFLNDSLFELSLRTIVATT